MPMTAPWAMGTRAIFGFSGAKTSKSLKNRELRAPRTTVPTDIVVSPTDAKSDEPAKMTHSISDFWGRLQA